MQGVYHCGYHSESSFAASSYFITRPDGNILIDRCVFFPYFRRKTEWSEPDVLSFGASISERTIAAWRLMPVKNS